MAHAIVKYDLLENGIESLAEGVACFNIGNDNPRKYKFAVLHVFHGIELILKHRLAKVHPALIYADLNKPIQPSSRTASLEDCIERLSNVGVAMDTEWRNLCRKIAVIRNQLQHSHASLDVKECKEILGQNIKHLEQFMKRELHVELSNYVDSPTYRVLQDAILTFEDKLKRVQERIGEFFGEEPERQQNYEVIRCIDCGNESLVVLKRDNDSADCLYCDHEIYVMRCEKCFAIMQYGDPAYSDKYRIGHGPYLCNDCATIANDTLSNAYSTQDQHRRKILPNP